MYGGQKELVVKGYNNAAFQTDTKDSKSQYGFVFCLNEGVVVSCALGPNNVVIYLINKMRCDFILVHSYYSFAQLT